MSANPVPALRWVMDGRIIQNNTSPHHSQQQDSRYIITDVALKERGVERNYSLTITNVGHKDLGRYSGTLVHRRDDDGLSNYDDEDDNLMGRYTCVAQNDAGMADHIVTLTFDRGVVFGPNNQEAIIIGTLGLGVFSFRIHS